MISGKILQIAWLSFLLILIFETIRDYVDSENDFNSVWLISIPVILIIIGFILLATTSKKFIS